MLLLEIVLVDSKSCNLIVVVSPVVAMTHFSFRKICDEEQVKEKVIQFHFLQTTPGLSIVA